VSTGKKNAKRISPSTKSFLELFYPVHYKIGIEIEDALREGELSRHQAAILWLIRSEGEGGRRLSRKRIERSLTRFFELQSSALSKALRSLARPPLSLITLSEHAESGREKEVVLTRRGEQRIERMVERGRAFLQTMVDRLSAEEARNGVHFLSRVSEIIDALDDDGALPRARKRKATKEK
jgi:DNA-binding MarR family transcriptional regulator